eukprot:gene35613-43190_t
MGCFGLSGLKAQSNGLGSFAEVIKNPAVSLGAGVGGLIIILANRLMAMSALPESALGVVSDIQSRSDILAVMACSAVLLNALSDQEFATRERDVIALVGYALKTPIVTNNQLPQQDREKYLWLMNSILSTTPIKSICIFNEKYEFLGGAGVLSQPPSQLTNVMIQSSPILSKAIVQDEEVYLPDLQILPGKIEFSYLPINCQSVYILPLPMPQGGAIVVGTNQAKVLKYLDLNRIRSLVEIFGVRMAP